MHFLCSTFWHSHSVNIVPANLKDCGLCPVPWALNSSSPPHLSFEWNEGEGAFNKLFIFLDRIKNPLTPLIKFLVWRCGGGCDWHSTGRKTEAIKCACDTAETLWERETATVIRWALGLIHRLHNAADRVEKLNWVWSCEEGDQRKKKKSGRCQQCNADAVYQSILNIGYQSGKEGGFSFHRRENSMLTLLFLDWKRCGGFNRELVNKFNAVQFNKCK